MKFLNYISIFFAGILIGGVAYYHYEKPKDEDSLQLYNSLISNFNEVEFIKKLFTFEKYKNKVCKFKTDTTILCNGLFSQNNNNITKEYTAFYKSVLKKKTYKCDVIENKVFANTELTCAETNKVTPDLELMTAQPFYTKHEYLSRIQETIESYRLEAMKFDQQFDEQTANDFAKAYIMTYSKLIQ